MKVQPLFLHYMVHTAQRPGIARLFPSEPYFKTECVTRSPWSSLTLTSSYSTLAHPRVHPVGRFHPSSESIIPFHVPDPLS